MNVPAAGAMRARRAIGWLTGVALATRDLMAGATASCRHRRRGATRRPMWSGAAFHGRWASILWWETRTSGVERIDVRFRLAEPAGPWPCAIVTSPPPSAMYRPIVDGVTAASNERGHRGAKTNASAFKSQK